MKRYELVSTSRNPYLLTATGLYYDGIDEKFDSVIRNQGDLPYFSHLELSQKTTPNLKVMTRAGDALFHITALAATCFRVLNSRKSDNQAFEKANALIPYIIKWMNCQINKMMNFDESGEIDVKSKNCSEFHMSQHLYDKSKDNMGTSFALKYIQCVLCEITNHYPEYQYHYQFAASFSRLEKLIRKSYQSSEPSSLKKKHQPRQIQLLNAIKFDILCAKLIALMQQKKYMLAEIFSNKCIIAIKNTDKECQQSLMCLIYAIQAYIWCQRKDIDMSLRCVDQVLKIQNKTNEKKEQFNIEFILKNSPNFTNACVFVGDYFEQDKKIDVAIKYYVEAVRYSANAADLVEFNQKIKELEAQFVSQIEKEIKGEFNNILNNIKSYPNHKTLIIYFKSSDDFNNFIKILSNKKIEFKLLLKSKNEDDKNALAFQIDYEFNTDELKKAFEKLKIQKDQEQHNKMNMAESRNLPLVRPKNVNTNNNQLLGLTGSHPKAASTKTKPKKTQNNMSQETTVSKWAFLEQRKVEKLERIEFKKTNRFFDPTLAHGVVTLRVNGLSGRWFAYMNPRIIEELEKIKKGEGEKLLTRFKSDIELAKDLCVPCYKEMNTKSTELGIDLPYLFKIRVLGADGLGNVRVYAKLKDETQDGKRLVEFCAINPKSHLKHTRPLEFDSEDNPVVLVSHKNYTGY